LSTTFILFYLSVYNYIIIQEETPFTVWTFLPLYNKCSYFLPLYIFIFIFSVFVYCNAHIFYLCIFLCSYFLFCSVVVSVKNFFFLKSKDDCSTKLAAKVVIDKRVNTEKLKHWKNKEHSSPTQCFFSFVKSRFKLRSF
jgi:hypothetical protein